MLTNFLDVCVHKYTKDHSFLQPFVLTGILNLTVVLNLTSILVGLALDYDIFLMSRVVEFRRMGWSDRCPPTLHTHTCRAHAQVHMRSRRYCFTTPRMLK